jgi:hypothetical protein
MKNFRSSVLIVTVLTMGVVGNACNSGQSASNTSQPDMSPSWTLQYQATCAANTDPAGCVGAYGFTVAADGSYQVGPGPQGQIAKGHLEAEDFSTLTQTAAGAVDGTAMLSAESCNGYYGNVSDYTLTLVKHGHKTEVLHKTGADLCSSKLEQDSAEALHNEILALADKYYPTPFPDACLEAAAEVEALYPSVEKCSTDAECGYLTADYTPIPTDSAQTVYVDNCSHVTNLPAANLAAINASGAKLQAALQKAQQICGVRIARDNCSMPKSFSSSAAPAVCQQGVCRVNPILGF